MGRTAVFTQEQVFEVAEKLAANGQEVTPNALRDLLGRGSFSTFVKHIDAWQQARTAAPLPVILEMPESVKSAASVFWQAAASEAGKEIAAIREKADAEVKSTKRRLDEAIAAVELLEGEAETDAAKLEAIGIELAAAHSASQQAATDAAAREAGLTATADQMRQQIEDLQAELTRLHSESEAWAAKYSKDMQRSVSEAEHYRGVVIEVEDKLEASLARERVTIEEAATAKAEVKRLSALVGEHSAALQASNAEIVREAALFNEARKVFEAELGDARKEYRALAAQYGKASGAVEALKTQVAGQADLIKRLTPSKPKASIKPKV